MHRMIRSVRLLLVALSMVTLSACSQGPFEGINRGGKLHGKVTVGDSPVGGGEVLVFGADGKHSASGKIRNDGSYSIVDPPMGPCKLAVVTSGIKGVPPKSKARGPVDYTDLETGEWPIYVAIHPDYEDKDKSGLTVEVPKGDHLHDIKLDKKGK